MMQNVLADLCVESEAATQLAIRLTRAYEPDAEPNFKRIATAVSKYWVCKRATPLAAEALECLGGNGFVEESPMPRLLRDSPLNSIWEGSGNVIALDVLRATAKDPETLEAFLADVELARGMDDRLDHAMSETRRQVEAMLTFPGTAEYVARRAVERMALTLQGSLIIRHSPPAVAEAFLSTRIAGNIGFAFGTLPRGIDAPTIIERHRPKLASG